MSKNVNSDETVEKLQRVLQTGQAGRVVSFFDAMPEKERANLVPTCLDWQKKIRSFINVSTSGAWHENEKVFQKFIEKPKARVSDYLFVANLAILASADFATVKKVLGSKGGDPLFNLEEKTESVLRSRKATWTLAFLEWYMQIPDNWCAVNTFWFVYRRFVKEGWLKPSTTEPWIRFMFSSMKNRSPHWGGAGRKNVPLVDQLRSDPALIENELWQIFEATSFPHSWSYTSIDSDHVWKDAFVALINDGTLEKFRVLDASLRALRRPLTDHQGKWFVQLLERIPLSDEELLANSEKLLRLLEHSNPAVRNFGTKILERMIKSGAIKDEAVLSCVKTFFHDPVKGKAKKALTLLEKIAKKNVTLRPEICRIALEGLRHESTEIQQGAVDLLQKYDGFSDVDIFDAVCELVPFLALSVQKSIPGLKTRQRASKIEPAQKESSCTSPSAKKNAKIDVLALFKSLAQKSPSDSIAALDTIITHIADGNLKSNTAIPRIRKLLDLKIITVGRWKTHFKTIAEQSDFHAAFIFELLQGIIDLIPPRELGAFLEIMYEISLVLEKPIQNESCRNFLSALTSGKAAKLAKSLIDSY